MAITRSGLGMLTLRQMMQEAGLLTAPKCHKQLPFGDGLYRPENRVFGDGLLVGGLEHFLFSHILGC